MLHHISLPITDIARARRFYDAALAPLGYRCVFAGDEVIGYGVEDGKDKLSLKKRATARPASDGFHLAFAAPSQDAVASFHDAALAFGGTDNGGPGLRPAYGPQYYAAFVIDPDGHRLEAVHK